MTFTIGVDPGASGAIAILDESGALVAVHDMPCVVKGSVSPEALANLEPWADDRFGTVVIEDVHSMPKQGVASVFKFGEAKGILRGVFAMAGRPVVFVPPQKWKRQMGLTSDKGVCRQRAIETWPSMWPDFKLVRHDGRAEAALIALWHVRQERHAA